MSLIYSITTYLTRNIEEKLRNSLLFTTIFNILYFIENQWVNSFFKGLYPNKNFLSIVKKSRILSKHIFAPLIVILTFSAFLLLSTEPLTHDLQFTIILGFASFIIGSMILPKFILNNIKDNDLKTEKEYNKNNENTNLKTEKISLPKFKTKDIYSIGFCLVIVGIIFFFLSIASVGGLPILKTSLRYSLKPALTMPVFLMIPGLGLIGASYLNRFKEGNLSRSQARFRFLLLLVIGAVFLLTLGYRTPIIAILLILMIIGYYGEIFAVWEIILGALAGVVAIVGIGYFRSVEDYMLSNANPFSTLQNRADFTLNVLNLLNQISGNFGIAHGGMLSSSMPGSDLGPRMLVGKLIAWRTEVTVTPTLFGQMLVDFGKLGVAIEMGLLGFILGTGYKIMKKTKNAFFIALYSLLLTYAILGVETGILDIQVLFYYFIGIIIYLAIILKDKRIKIY